MPIDLTHITDSQLFCQVFAMAWPRMVDALQPMLCVIARVMRDDSTGAAKLVSAASVRHFNASLHSPSIVDLGKQLQPRYIQHCQLQATTSISIC